MSSSTTGTNTVPLQSILTLAIHGVPSNISPEAAEFAHLRSVVRTALNDKLNPRGVHLISAELDDWAVQDGVRRARRQQHDRLMAPEEAEAEPEREVDRPTDEPRKEGGDDSGSLMTQLTEMPGSRGRRRLSSTTLSGRKGGYYGTSLLYSFLNYLYDAPVTATATNRRQLLAASDATADLAVTLTITGEQTPDYFATDTPLRPELFTSLVNRAALSSSEEITSGLKPGGWLGVVYFHHTHGVSLVPRDDGGVILSIPGDESDLLLPLQLEADGGSDAMTGRSPSLMLAGRASTGDYSPDNNVEAASGAINEATGIETSRGFLLDADSPSYVPSSDNDNNNNNNNNNNKKNLNIFEDHNSAAVNPTGNGGRVSLGLALFIALACIFTVLFSAYLTRRAVKRKRQGRVTKAREAYEAPQRICSREWIGKVRDRIKDRRSRSRVGATPPRQQHQEQRQPKKQQQRMAQTNTPIGGSIRDAAGLPPNPAALAAMPPGGRPLGGVMDTRAEYALSSLAASTAATSGGKRVRFGADSIAGENVAGSVTV